MERTGPLRDRVALRALRFGVIAWRLGARLGIDVAGSTEGPRITPHLRAAKRRRAA